MPLEAVDYDPFASTGPTRITVRPEGAVDLSKAKLEPVDHDPFARSWSDTASGLSGSLETGVEKGAAGAIGSLGDLTDLGAAGIGKASDYISDAFGLPKYERPADASILDNIPRAADIQKHFNDTYRGGAEPYKAQTPAERYTQAGGEFLLGAAGPGGVFSKAAQVALPAITSETAGHALEGTPWEGAARFGGALFGGGVGALASRPGTAARAIRQQLPPGVTPQMVDQAGALIATAKQQGIDLAWPEALSKVAGRPVLTNMMRHLEASPQTEAQMGAFFGPRPQQIENAARTEFNKIAPVNQAPSTIGPAVGRAADSTISDTRGAINRASEPYYQAAEANQFSPQEFNIIKTIPGFDDALAAVRSNPQINWRIKHLPDNSVGVLNEVKKYFDQAAQNSASKFNPAANQQVKASNEMAADALKQVNVAKSQDYEIALGIQQQAREKYLQPLLDGPLGTLAKKNVTTQKAIDVLFPTTPLANSHHEITDAVSALAKRNPNAAEDLVRAHLESAFNRSAKDLQSGANQAGGAKFRAQVAGNAQQAANLQAAVDALPGGQKKWDGFKSFLDVLEATGTRQGIGSRTTYNAEINKAQSAGGLVRDGVKIATNPIRVFQPLIDKYEQYKLGKNLSELANILTDRRSAPLLKSIAGMAKDSANAQMVALKLLTYIDASSVKKPNQ